MNIKDKLLAAKRFKVAITVEGEKVDITCKPISPQVFLQYSKNLVSGYGAVNGTASGGEEMDMLSLMRAAILSSVIDPPLADVGTETELSPEDLGVSNWAILFEEIAKRSDLGIMFPERERAEAATEVAVPERPDTALPE